MPAADAIAALRAAGHCVTKTTRADAARRYGCQTALYVINGRGVNLGRLRQLASETQAVAPAFDAIPEPEPVAALEPAAVSPSPVLPGEPPRPAAPKPAGPEPLLPNLPPVAPAAVAPACLAPACLAPAGPHTPATLAALRADAMAGRPVSLTAVAQAVRVAQAVAAVADRPAPTGEGFAGQPWDPGTPEARARVALQGERAGILWPIARALTGEGLTLPASWATDGPALAGELPVAQALARLPLGAIATAAKALAALPPVTPAQDAALSLCDTGAVPGRPYL